MIGGWKQRLADDAAKKAAASAAAPPAGQTQAPPASPASAPPSGATKPATTPVSEPAKAAAPPAPPASEPAPAKAPAHPAVAAAGGADRDKVDVSRPREPEGRAGPVNPPVAPEGGPVDSRAPLSEEHRPLLLDGARESKPDDLKLIRGVGPKLEQVLNRLGIFHFAQIAEWTEMNLRWVDQHLGAFRGRGLRDDWIGQSKKLAAGWRPDSTAGDKPKS
jgi:NADH-quinone oxidoreductase subunit E